MNAFALFKKQDENIRDERDRLNRKWEELREKESEFAFNNEYGRIHNLSTVLIFPNRSQPRTNFEDSAIIKLADSIRQYGILQPLTVRRLSTSELNASKHFESVNGAVSNDIELEAGDESKIEAGTAEPVNMFELVAGERRLRAAKLIGLDVVPCIIIDADTKRSAELAIIENLQREDLNMFEQASAIASLIEIYNMTQEQVARQLSTSQSYVANKLRILRLDDEERDIILKNGLTERHARAVLKMESGMKRLDVLKQIVAKTMNVSATEDYIESLLATKEPEAEHGKHRFVIRDMRMFYNTINKAVETVRKAGISVMSRQKEENGFVELTIRVPTQMQYKR